MANASGAVLRALSRRSRDGPVDEALLNRFRSDDTRRARRLARIARWDRPLAGALSRLRAWTNMVLVDHGVFRLVYLNRHRVSERLWRSAQPAPHQLARFAREGVRTIVNLRGGREHGSWPLQREACERHGLTLAEFVVRSREAPDLFAGTVRAWLDGTPLPSELLPIPAG